MIRIGSLIGLAIAFVGVAIWYLLPSFVERQMVHLLIATQLLFGFSVAIYLLSKRVSPQAMRWLFPLLIGLSILVRAVLGMGSNERLYLSDDAYRYVWDGRVTLAGINPYLYPPVDSHLTNLHENYLYPRINHPLLPTIYPPAAQIIFAATVALGGYSILAIKAAGVLFELITIAMMLLLLRAYEKPRELLILYIFSPLMLCESYLSVHVDIFALPFFALSLIWLRKEHAAGAGIMLAVATLVKFTGAVFAPFFFFGLQGRARWRFFVAFCATIAVLYSPFVLGAGTKVLGSLFTYLEDWQFNASLYFLLKYPLGLEQARGVVSLLLGVWIVALMFLKPAPVKRSLQAFGGFVVCTPTLYPWYYLWGFPLLLLERSPAFLWYSGAILLSYHVLIGYYSDGSWSVYPWLGVVAYLPFFLLMIPSLSRRFRF